MSPSKLERAILDWFAAHHPSLASRLAAADVKRREYTGVGYFVYLSDEDWTGAAVAGPLIESPSLDMGAMSVLWLAHGEPCCLEIAAFGDDFPEQVDEFELS